MNDAAYRAHLYSNTAEAIRDALLDKSSGRDMLAHIKVTYRLNVESLANLLGCSPQTVYSYERGDYKVKRPILVLLYILEDLARTSSKPPYEILKDSYQYIIEPDIFKRIREEVLDIDVKDLSVLLAISKNAVYKYENGSREAAGTIRILMELLETRVSPTELYDSDNYSIED